MYHVRSRNQHLPSVIRNSELIVKILGKSDNNPDHLDIGVSRDIGDEGKRDVARIFSGMGQCDEFDQHVIVGVFQWFRLEKSDGRLGHRAPGRDGRRASIPLHALTTLLSALGAFCLWEFRVSQQISTFYGPSVQAMETRLGARQRRRPRRFTEVVPTPHAYSGQWPVKTKRARARNCASVVTRKRPSLNRAQNEPKSRLQLDSLHALASDGFVPLPGIEPNHDKWHPEKSAELVTSPIGE